MVTKTTLEELKKQIADDEGERDTNCATHLSR